nr:hybrid signal transduction histidine kinase k [Quercus suber]
MSVTNIEGEPTHGPRRNNVNHDWTNPAYPKPLTDFQRFIRHEVDWQKSPLGPVEHWPVALRQMVLMVVADPTPAVVFYGHPDAVAVVYNEAYTGLIGSKHPKLQGQLARVDFQELWGYLDKLLREQMESGLASVGEAHPLLLRRHGFLEESFFAFKLIPIISPDDGDYLGSYATVTERTAEVLFDRRMATVQRLGSKVAEASSLRDVWQAVIDGLAVNEHDLPLAAIYSVPSDVFMGPDMPQKTSTGQTCTLEGSLGIGPGNETVPARFDLHDETDQLAVACKEAASRNGTLLLRTIDNMLPLQLFTEGQNRGHGVPCEAAVICAVKDNLHNCSIGFLLLGLNPYRPYDAPYQDFIRMLTLQVTTPHVSNVLLRGQVEAGKVAATQSALERVQLDERLAASELKFSRFADSLSMGVGIADSNGRLLYSNKRWHHLVGIPEDDRAPFSFFQAFESDQEEVAPPDGQKHPTTALVTAYTDTNSKGEMMMMSCIADVSELKWVEDRLRQRTVELEKSELKYRKFADLAPVGVCVMCPNRIIQFTNDAFLKIMPHSTLSQDILNCVHSDDVEQVQAKLDTLTETATSVLFECRLSRTSPELSNHGEKPSNDTHGVTDDGGSMYTDDERSPPAWILASAHLEKNPETQIICWVTDISAQKMAQSVIQRRMDEALETKRQQERFIGKFSSFSVRHNTRHEEIIDNCKKRTDDISANTLEAAQTIEYCASHIGNIVGDVLALSKLDSGLVGIHTTAVKPKEVIMNALKMFGSEARAKNINITCQEHQSMREHGIEWLLMDPNRVLQVVVNLMTNAIKFISPAKEHNISVLLSASAELPSTSPEGVSFISQRTPRPRVPFTEPEIKSSSIYFTVTIQDNGLGLGDEAKRLLFQRFKQASPKTESRYGGSGLGLFISRDLVELHGGGIGVASEEGIGSTFVFYIETKRATAPEQSPTIPLATTSLSPQQSHSELAARVIYAQPEARPMLPRSATLPSDSASIKVLIVEDNMINLKVLSKQLLKHGFHVVTAIHGEDALHILFTAHSSTAATAPAFDVVLMDIEMPVMDGITCVKEIRAAEVSGRLHGRLPIIAVTANVRDELTKTAMLAGVDAITTKPYHIADLVAQIGKTCL